MLQTRGWVVSNLPFLKIADPSKKYWHRHKSAIFGHRENTVSCGARCGVTLKLNLLGLNLYLVPPSEVPVLRSTVPGTVLVLGTLLTYLLLTTAPGSIHSTP
jgi:hypothetical protein